MNSIYLNKFKVVNPPHRIAQADLLKWVTGCHQLAENTVGGANSETLQRHFNHYGIKDHQISQRYMECSDIITTDSTQNQIYNINATHPSGVDIGTRTRFFAERANSVFEKIYDLSQKINRPDHLIHVSCTGYISPSAAQKVVTAENWGQNTAITHAYHMGCYAALPAVRLAKSLVQSEVQGFTTDIVHTEMCSLHMNPLSHSPEQMVVQTLFADGHIKYSATSELQAPGKNLKIIALHEKVVPNSMQDMSWIPAPWGMQMNLSREVPAKIKLELKAFANELYKKAGLDLSEAMNSIFAVHPGGPKIIQSVQDVLELSDEQVLESKKVLRLRGNMSSATLPHVWVEILENNYAVGTKIISFAFGPGLTLFGAVFEVC